MKLRPFSPILPVLEKYIFTLLNGAIEKFCDLKGIFLVGQVPLFFEKKKNSFKIGLTVYASVPLHWFTQVCPCVKRTVFFAFFLKIACTFALHVGKRKGPRKIYFSLGVDCHPRTT